MLLLLIALSLPHADATSLLTDYRTATDADESARQAISSLGSAIMHENWRLDVSMRVISPVDAADAITKLAEADKWLLKATDDMKAGRDRLQRAMESWNSGTLLESQGKDASAWYAAASVDFAGATRWFTAVKQSCDSGRGWVSCAKGIIDPWYAQATAGWWNWFTSFLL